MTNPIKITKRKAISANKNRAEFKLSKKSIVQSINQRVSKEYIAPEKLINLHPRESTAYDFN
jgi:hypothetical protein